MLVTHPECPLRVPRSARVSMLFVCFGRDFFTERHSWSIVPPSELRVRKVERQSKGNLDSGQRIYKISQPISNRETWLSG